MASQSADDTRILFSETRNENDVSAPAVSRQAGEPTNDDYAFSVFAVSHSDRAESPDILSAESGPSLDFESEVPSSPLKSHSPPPREMLTRSSRFLYARSRSSNFIWDFIPFLLAYLLLLATTRLHHQTFPREEDHDRFPYMPLSNVNGMNGGPAFSPSGQTRLPSYFEATRQDRHQEQLTPNQGAREPDQTTTTINVPQRWPSFEPPPNYEAPAFGDLPSPV